jgi:hypothetical protein
MELSAQHIATLEEALQLERARLEQLDLEDRYINWILGLDRTTAVGTGAPAATPPLAGGCYYYDAASDAVYAWQDMALIHEPPELFWALVCTEASRHNYVRRYWRQQYLAQKGNEDAQRE